MPNIFSSARKKTQAMRASLRLFDEAIEKIGKQDVQVINAQFLSIRLSEPETCNGSGFTFMKTGEQT